MKPDDKQNWLDEYGRMVFQNKANPNIFAFRYYYWKDLVTFIDESNGRKHIGQTHFQHILDKIENWIPITKQEDQLVKKTYKEIKQIRRYLKLKEILER